MDVLVVKSVSAFAGVIAKGRLNRVKGYGDDC